MRPKLTSKGSSRGRRHEAQLQRVEAHRGGGGYGCNIRCGRLRMHLPRWYTT